jgi:hypothetical protein
MEVGLILAAGREPAECIGGGILASVFIDKSDRLNPRLLSTIDRKFGKQIGSIVRRTAAPGAEILDQDIVPIACAVEISQLSDNLTTDSGHRTNPIISPILDSISIPKFYFDQLQILIGTQQAIKHEDQQNLHYSSDDLQRMSKGLRYASILFNEQTRRWGSSEVLPMISHAADVGFLLLLAGEQPELVLAGILHDALEGYAATEAPEIKEEILRIFPGPRGSRVVELIEGVTEPEKISTPGNWLHRKLSVVRSIEQGDVDLAKIFCASKISTLAAGNRFLYERRTSESLDDATARWSRGSYHDNVRLFEHYLWLCESKGAGHVLTDQLLLEINRFRSPATKMSI